METLWLMEKLLVTCYKLFLLSPHRFHHRRLIAWVVFYAAFNNNSVLLRRQLTLCMSFLGFTSTRLGLWSVLPKDTPTKNPEDQTLYHWATQDPHHRRCYQFWCFLLLNCGPLHEGKSRLLQCVRVHSLISNDKVMVSRKLKRFADGQINVTEVAFSVF